MTNRFRQQAGEAVSSLAGKDEEVNVVEVHVKFS